MLGSGRLRIDDVRAELNVELVLQAYGVQARRRGSQYRLATCPRCGEKSAREAVAINATTGRWIHFGHERDAGGGCAGDLVELVAALEGLHMRRDSRRVIGRCAELAGVSVELPDHELAARRARREREATDRRRREVVEQRERRERALVIAGEHWAGLRRRHPRGEQYLRGRGIDPAPLVERDLVRFEACGDVAGAQHTADGRIVNVVRRRLTPRAGGPKVLALRDCPTTGTLLGALPNIEPGRDVVLVEGLTDALVASLAWPRAVVLGANGAGALRRIAVATAPRVRLAGVRMSLVPDRDDVGRRAMHEAELAAGDVGAFVAVLELDVDGAKDLSDAWRLGWRPTEAER